MNPSQSQQPVCSDSSTSSKRSQEAAELSPPAEASSKAAKKGPVVVRSSNLTDSSSSSEDSEMEDDADDADANDLTVVSTVNNVFSSDNINNTNRKSSSNIVTRSCVSNQNVVSNVNAVSNSADPLFADSSRTDFRMESALSNCVEKLKQAVEVFSPEHLDSARACVDMFGGMINQFAPFVNEAVDAAVETRVKPVADKVAIHGQLIADLQEQSSSLQDAVNSCASAVADQEEGIAYSTNIACIGSLNQEWSDQKSRSKSLMIFNLPVDPREKDLGGLRKVVLELFGKLPLVLEAPLTAASISRAFRHAKAAKGFPAVYVEFVRGDDRDEIMKKKKQLMELAGNLKAIRFEDSITKERAFVLGKLINLSREGRFDFVTVKDGGKIVVRMLENDAGVKDFVHIERLDQIDRLGIDEREFVPILEEAFGFSKSSGEGDCGRRDPQ